MRNFLSFINIDFLTGRDTKKNWRMLIFLSLLIMLSIYSSHEADQKIFLISKLNKEVNYLNNISVTTKINLMDSKMESKIAEKLSSIGLTRSEKPPIKVIIKN